MFGVVVTVVLGTGNSRRIMGPDGTSQSQKE